MEQSIKACERESLVVCGDWLRGVLLLNLVHTHTHKQYKVRGQICRHAENGKVRVQDFARVWEAFPVRFILTEKVATATEKVATAARA